MQQESFQVLHDYLAQVVAHNLAVGVDFGVAEFDPKNRAREERQEAQRRHVQNERETYGSKVADAVFGMRTVRIYEKGFVRICLPLFESRAKFERLLSIESSADVSKKSGVGRATGALLTGGLNVIAASNKRGDVYLTIATDAQTHVLHEDPPTASNMKIAKRLEAVGRGVLAGLSTNESATVGTSHLPGKGTAERLRELGDLLAQGLVDQAEYDEQRTRLLGEL